MADAAVSKTVVETRASSTLASGTTSDAFAYGKSIGPSAQATRKHAPWAFRPNAMARRPMARTLQVHGTHCRNPGLLTNANLPGFFRPIASLGRFTGSARFESREHLRLRNQGRKYQ